MDDLNYYSLPHYQFHNLYCLWSHHFNYLILQGILETCLSSVTYCVSLPHLVLLWFPLHGKAKGKTKRVLSLVTCMKQAQIDGSCSLSYRLSPQFHWWDPVLLLRTKNRLCKNASEGRIKNHCTLSEAKWVFKLANKKVMRNACSPEPPKENQQTPATMQTFSTVGSGDFQTRHRGLVGLTGENNTEIATAEGCARENHGRISHWRQRQRQSTELPSVTGHIGRLLLHPPKEEILPWVLYGFL